MRARLKKMSVIARARVLVFLINCINVEKVTTDVLTTFPCLLLSTSGNPFVLNDNIVVVRPLIVKPIKMRV